jgi:predicted RNA-binding protein YlqC (UPF0109 family)
MVAPLASDYSGTVLQGFEGGYSFLIRLTKKYRHLHAKNKADKNLVMIYLELKVAQDDLGKIIGKQGRTAKAIRTILGAASAKQNKRTIFEIVE